MKSNQFKYDEPVNAYYPPQGIQGTKLSREPSHLSLNHQHDKGNAADFSHKSDCRVVDKAPSFLESDFLKSDKYKQFQNMQRKYSISANRLQIMQKLSVAKRKSQGSLRVTIVPSGKQKLTRFGKRRTNTENEVAGQGRMAATTDISYAWTRGDYDLLQHTNQNETTEVTKSNRLVPTGQGSGSHSVVLHSRLQPSDHEKSQPPSEVTIIATEKREGRSSHQTSNRGTCSDLRI